MLVADSWTTFYVFTSDFQFTDYGKDFLNLKLEGRASDFIIISVLDWDKLTSYLILFNPTVWVNFLCCFFLCLLKLCGPLPKIIS